jgi:hypothetical protein
MKSTSNAVVGGWVALIEEGVGMIEFNPRHDADRVEPMEESDRSELAESDEERDLPATELGTVDLDA